MEKNKNKKLVKVDDNVVDGVIPGEIVFKECDEIPDGYLECDTPGNDMQFNKSHVSDNTKSYNPCNCENCMPKKINIRDNAEGYED
jgi:hypothetical protein